MDERPTVELMKRLLRSMSAYVRKTAVLIAVGAPMRYVMVTHLSFKIVGVLKFAMFKHVAKYERRGLFVSMLFCDGESGVSKILSDLEVESFDVQIAGPEVHVGKVEVAIRDIKQMARARIDSTL